MLLKSMFSSLILFSFLSQSFAAPPASVSSLTESRGKKMEQFFESIEKNWRGEGVFRKLSHEGTYEEKEYDIRMDVDADHWDKVWELDIEKRFEDSTYQYDNPQYHVRNDFLFLGQYSNEPVQVTEVNEKKLSYQFQRTDVLTGRTYYFVIEMKKARYHFEASVTVTLNGVMIEQDTFKVK